MASDNIQVAVKSRPLIAREKSEKLRSQWTIQENTIYQIDDDGYRLGEPYSFDHIFDENSSNEEVYNSVVEPLVKSCLKGFNSTIFAYGQTSSGKTHTMMGTDSSKGLIQLAVNDIFGQVEQNRQRRYLIRCSYFEIYNEKINDLLDKNGKDLKIHEDFSGTTFVNAKEEIATVPAEVFDLMKVGNKIRKIGCTNMNERSSRSHTIFRITIESTENDIENGPVQISQLNLVDLAGSERVAQTKAEGVRLKEGVNINKSLSVLGNVIRRLSESEGFINYRDSKLTRLLRTALGGNAKSLIIATVTLATGEETKSTLEFAQRAKVIKNKPVINEILTEQDKVKQYELITAAYKERLESEKLHIREMEREKEEREKEIAKLKQHVKLIDVFTKGPKVMKAESRIPRRHTVGHYGSRIPLQTIPESNILPTSSYDIKVDNRIKYDSDDEEVLSKADSQEADDDFKIFEELEENSFASTPEPPEDSTLESATEEMMSYYLRKRLKSLEESYNSLLEFTKSEAACQDKESLQQELEQLSQENHTLRTSNQRYKEEIEQMQVKLSKYQKREHEDEDIISKLYLLQDILSQVNNDVQGVSTQTDLDYVEKIDALESHKLQMEQEIQEYKKEIAVFEETKSECDQLKKDTLQKEEKIEQLLQKINDLEDYKLEIEQQNKKCKEEIAVIKNNGINYDQLKKDTELKEEKITMLLKKIENLENYQLIIEEKNKNYKEKMAVFEETEKKTVSLRNDIEQKDADIKILLKKIEDFESYILEVDQERKKYEERIAVLKEIETKYDQVKKDIQQHEIQINELLEKINSLENYKLQIEQENNKYKEEIADIKETEINYYQLKEDIEFKEEEIRMLLKEIENLKNCKLNMEEEIKMYKEQLLVFEEAEKDTESLKKEVKQKEEEIQILSKKVENLEIYILEVEQENRQYKGKTEIKEQEMKMLMKRIENLENCKLNMEEESKKYKEKIVVLEETNPLEDIEQKEKQIKILLKKIEYLESYKMEMEQENQKYKEKTTILEETKEKYDELKKNIRQEQEKIDGLLEKINSLQSYKLQMEQDNNKCKTETAATKETEMKYNQLKKNTELKEEKINILLKKFDELESYKLKLEEDNKKYMEKIAAFEATKGETGSLKKCIKQKEEKINKLLEKINNLEICNLQTEVNYNQLRKNMDLKDEKIKMLVKRIDKLESDKLKVEEDNKKYKEKIETFQETERDTGSLKKCIEQKEEKIKLLLRNIENFESNRQEVEQENKMYKEEIALLKQAKAKCVQLKENILQRDVKINTLLEKINSLEISKLQIEQENNKFKKEIAATREIEINYTQLRKDADLKDEKIKTLLKQISKLESYILTVKEENTKYKEKIVTFEEIGNEASSLKKSIEQEEEEIKLLLKKVENLELEQENKRELNLPAERVEKRKSLSSPATSSSSSLDLSPKEIRRRKRQSVYDQRRGIDTEVYTERDAIATDSTETEKELKEKIQKLTLQVEKLTDENNFLEFEVQGFIREVDDYRNYYKEQEDEIENLKQQLTNVKHNQQSQDQKCDNREHQIKQLEDLQNKNMLKIVDLQTKVFDLQDKHTAENSNQEEKIRRLKYRITELERKVGGLLPREVTEAEIQCDLMNYGELLEKYTMIKKLARMRRDEGNLLKAKLGMSPDDPIT